MFTILGFLAAGLIIGALARFIKKGPQDLSLGMTMLLGVVASVIGGLAANLFGTGEIFELNVFGFIVAVIAAVLIIGFAESRTGTRV